MLGLVLVASTLTGQVTSATSHWTADGSRIVTEATLHADTGEDVVVSQLGGTVDGLTMRTFPGPDVLEQGMRVTVDVRDSMDLSQRMHHAVEGVKVEAYPAGFVRTGPTKAGHYLFWESGCVFLNVDSAGTKEVPGDGEFPIVQAAIDTWNTSATQCSYINIHNEGPKALETARDRINLIKFRDQSWCRPATGDDPARCHPDSAAGITTATYVDDGNSYRDGALVDADIEINGVNFAIAVNGGTQGNAPCKAELQNTLTHELGHLLGLEHTCLASGDPNRVDDQGKAVPLCSATSDPKITEATMFNFQECGETKKETPEADDVAAVCSVYPTEKDPGTCDHVDETGCDSCNGTGHPTPWSLLFGLALFARSWRRRRH